MSHIALPKNKNHMTDSATALSFLAIRQLSVYAELYPCN